MPTKHIILFTAMDDARRRLKSNVQLVFTLTPVDTSFSPDSYPPIVYTILTFQQSIPEAKAVSFSGDVGFSVVKLQEDSTISPSDLCMPVDLEHMAILGTENGIVNFDEPRRMANTQAPVISVFNNTGVPQPLVLCSVDNSDADGPRFHPAVDIGQLKHRTTLECGPPVMLQAYAVSGYKKGQILKPGDLNRFVFADPAGEPQPIDIRQVTSGSLFRLYTKWNKAILEPAL